MMKYPPIIFLLLFIATVASAQKLTATIDRKDILIGERIQLRLQADFVSNENIEWFDVDTISRFEILQKSDVDTTRAGTGISLSQTLTLTSWDSGKLLLPAFQLGSGQTTPLQVNVRYEPHPFDTTQPYHDVKDILEVKRPIEETWYWYLILVLVILGLFLLFFPKGKKKPAGVFVPDEGAFRKAIRQLEQLKNTDADKKVFYTEMIRIFREYLHRRKNIYSFSKTTNDLAIQMQRLQMDRDQYAHLLQTLRLSDLVKYAQYKPSAEEDETAIETLKESIVNIENLPHVV